MGLCVGIVGAGPAGTACAIALAGSGHDVTIFEKMPPPRDKACGDALIPDAVRCLVQLGVFGRVVPHLFPVSRLRLVSPGGVAVDAEGDIYTCRRARFDELLLEAARDHGARLVVGEVTGVAEDADGVRVQCGDGAEARFNFVVGATGASARALSLYGLAYRKRPSAYAMRQYVRLPRPHGMDRIEVYYDRGLLPGYGWVFPVGPRELNVGVGALGGRTARHPPNLHDLYRRFLGGHPTCAALLAESLQRGPLRGAPLRTGLRGAAYGKGRVLLCGEAVGATYAMTGEGIGKAMETGIVAARVLDSAWRTDRARAVKGIAAAYGKDLERRMRRKFAGYDRGQRWMSFPWVIDLLARKARRREGVRAMLSGILAETVDPTEILSARRLAALALAVWK